VATDSRNYALRYAFGTTACVALAFAFGWTLAHLTPILAAAFLGNRGPRPGLKVMLGILVAITLFFGSGFFVTVYLYPYPFAFILLFCAALYINYFQSASGQSGFLVLLFSLAVLLLPLLGGTSTALAYEVCKGFLISASIALAVVQVVHTLFPSAPTPSAAAATPTPPDDIAASAWLSTAVVLPFALACLVFNVTGLILSLIIIAMLSQKPDFSTGVAGGKALLAANVGGGIVAIAFYQLMLINPSYIFTLTGLLALALFFGQRLFSDRPTAPLYGTAFNTVLILIGSSTGAYSGEADSNFYTRIGQLLLAVSYAVGAFSLLGSLRIRARILQVGGRLRIALQGVSRLLPG
jgi:hypothetical protein